MSLATRCPACGTAFRVVQDQLRVSDGWVRCGQCQEVFNALEGLFDLRAPAPGAEVAAPPEPAASTRPDEFVLTDEPSTPTPPTADAEAWVEPANPQADPELARDTEALAGHFTGADSGAAALVPEPGLDFDLDLALDGQRPGPTATPGATLAAADASPGEVTAAADRATAPALHGAPAEPAATDMATDPATDASVDASSDTSADTSADPHDALLEPPIEPPPRRAVPPGLRLRERARARAQARADAAHGADGPPPMAIALDDPAADPPADADAATDGSTHTTADRRRRRRMPGFVAEAERAARWQRPAVRAVLGGAALLLTAGALAQAGWLFRDELSARHPGLAPALQALCRPLGCTVQAPRALQRLSVEGAALNRLPDGDAAAATHRLSVLVRNAADHRVAAPAIDLALSDAAGRPVARRVLQGRELGDGVANDIAAGGEWSVQLALRVDDPRVAGFTVEIFYP